MFSCLRHMKSRVKERTNLIKTQFICGTVFVPTAHIYRWGSWVTLTCICLICDVISAGFNTMFVLVSAVGTKVGTNFLNTQEKFDFFQMNFFFSKVVHFSKKNDFQFTLSQKRKTKIEFVWKLVPTLVPLVGLGTNTVWYPGFLNSNKHRGGNNYCFDH